MAVGTFVAGGVGVIVAGVLIFAIFWSSSEDSRARRESLASLPSVHWIADARIDSASLDEILRRSGRASTARPPKDYGLAVSGDELQLWETADQTAPLTSIPLSQLAQLERAPVMDRVWRGELVLHLINPRDEVELALNGPLWGAIAPSEAAVRRFRTELRLASS